MSLFVLDEMLVAVKLLQSGVASLLGQSNTVKFTEPTFQTSDIWLNTEVYYMKNLVHLHKKT